MSHLEQILSELNAVRPPAPLELLRELEAVDFGSMYAAEPDLVLDLVLRITADSIVANYDLREPERTHYLETLQIISGKLNQLSGDTALHSELKRYTRTFGIRLVEFK